MALRRAGGRSAAGNELAAAVSWREAKATIGRPELRVHDLPPHAGFGVAGIWR